VVPLKFVSFKTLSSWNQKKYMFSLFS
jgi:hypothetical protein